MALRVEPVARRKPAPESVDLFLSALAVSFLLHLIGCILVYISPYVRTSQIKHVEPEPYVVHLVDPGPLATATKSLAVKKTKRKTDRFYVPSKTTASPKEIVAVSKKKIVKQLKDTRAKTTKKVKKEDKVTASLVRKQKTGGTIDIKGFPYEWYLQIMESKVYENWDTLTINLFSDRTLKATVYFQIDRQGQVNVLKLEESSLDEEMDNSALEAVRLSEPFPPLPPGYKEDILEVHFGFIVETKL